MIIYGIYLKDNLVYIGQTRSRFSLRISKYKSDAKLKRNTSMLIIRSIIKHGFDKFEFRILDTTNDLNKLNELEIFYIEKHKPRYNLTSGGSANRKVSKLSRKRISDANRRRKPWQFRTQSIICLDTGEIFYSQSQASRVLKIGRKNITNVVNGWSNTAGGLRFIKTPIDM